MLKDVQQRFYDLVTAPEPLPEAMSRLGVSAAEIDADFVGDARASAAERLAIYGDMYFIRIRDVLSEQFAKLHVVLGQARFHNLVGAYLARHVPANPSLRWVGARLPGFLAEDFALADRAVDPEDAPWLAELALLEWTHLDLFDGPDVDALGVEDIHEMSPESLSELRLSLVPTQRLLRLKYRVDLLEDEEGAVPAAEPVSLLVWRHGVHVAGRVVDEVEAGVLAQCARSAPTFAEACESLGEALGEEEAASRAFLLLSRWLMDGVLAKGG